MATVKGTSATGKAARVVHVRKYGNKLMMCITKPGDLFQRHGAVVISADDLIKKIAATKNGKP